MSTGWRAFRVTPLILAGSLAVSSCDVGGLNSGSDPLVRPVETRPTEERRTSLRKVRNDLYSYLETGSRDFRVRPEPPLSFAFPTAYYTLDTNHAGGAVSMIGLEADLATMGPFRTAPVVHNPDARTPRAEARESEVRGVYIDITSNYFVDVNDYIKRGVFEQTPSAADPPTIPNPPIDRSGYRIVTYLSVDDKVLSPQEKIIVGDLDIANTSLYATPLDKSRHKARRIECVMGNVNCEAEFIYHGRMVEVVFDKTLFAHVDKVVDKCEKLLVT